MWRYNLRTHFEKNHPHSIDVPRFKAQWTLTNFEKTELRKVWNDRNKKKATRKGKNPEIPLSISEAHSARATLRSVHLLWQQSVRQLTLVYNSTIQNEAGDVLAGFQSGTEDDEEPEETSADEAMEPEEQEADADIEMDEEALGGGACELEEAVDLHHVDAAEEEVDRGGEAVRREERGTASQAGLGNLSDSQVSG